MASEMKVEIIHKETIKPSSPTPHHLRYSNTSLFDQFAPDIYPAVVLFYPRTSTTDHHQQYRTSVADYRCKLLKASLSHTLSHFYPFAGRVEVDASRICCNDNGTVFVESQVFNCPISKIMDGSDPSMLKQLIATNSESTLASTGGYILLVQANFFQCGGMAIAISMSHKLNDAYTASRFIKSWATIANGSIATVVVPHWEQHGASASLFPPLDLSNWPAINTAKAESCVTKTRRFEFDASKIASLKSRATSTVVPRPSGVEAVSAFIWKCAMEASRLKLGFARPSVWCQMVDLRKILRQPLAHNLIGNFFCFFATKTEESSGHHEVDLKSLVAKLRTAMEQFKVDYGDGACGVPEICQNYIEFVDLDKRDDIDKYSCSSWCRFPFYDTDFGWGKPSLVSHTSMDFKNIVVLIDTSDGGIEASLTLEEQEMATIERNMELLASSSIHPISRL